MPKNTTEITQNLVLKFQVPFLLLEKITLTITFIFDIFTVIAQSHKIKLLNSDVDLLTDVFNLNRREETENAFIYGNNHKAVFLRN